MALSEHDGTGARARRAGAATAARPPPRGSGPDTLDLSPGIELRHPAALAGPAGLLRELLADLGVGAGPVPVTLILDESVLTVDGRTCAGVADPRTRHSPARRTGW